MTLGIHPKSKEALQAAASLRHKSVSEFILESALDAADEVLADRRYFSLLPNSGRLFKPRWCSTEVLTQTGTINARARFFRLNRKHPEKPQIVKLHQTHGVEAFDCGQDSLNQYLKRYALMSQRGDGAQTYVAYAGIRSLVITPWLSGKSLMTMLRNG
ncbi:DUF1778 domain-containing protein [Methylicorpusculum oleiharenae]|uniref:type II toxin-antitoxin system TacA family antitoxin n=1 Tax=Methylicorpusculum oleiharenae TaxID=1338687 RepID=UPI001E54E1CF|nr:DUF1778 domain-containing protein [Methylicorpusculum oleiharenae]MCD2453774.1 DUF1778 domain-containing protein [Methylicorpusculum oleiharenae]